MLSHHNNPWTLINFTAYFGDSWPTCTACVLLLGSYSSYAAHVECQFHYQLVVWLNTLASPLCSPYPPSFSGNHFTVLLVSLETWVLCASRWPWTSDPSLPISKVLRLKGCATEPNFVNGFLLLAVVWSWNLNFLLPDSLIFPHQLSSSQSISCFLSSLNDFSNYPETESWYLVLPSCKLLESWTFGPDVQ